jgi:hypothetical protein
MPDWREALLYARKILASAGQRGVGLRLAGSTAVALRCAPLADTIPQAFREVGDLDFVCAARQAELLESVVCGEFGYSKDRGVLLATEGQRWLLRSNHNPISIDVFFDCLQFCHIINLQGRITIDQETMTLVDLLLSKLQYVKPREKDLLDIAMLLHCHELMESEAGICWPRLVRVLSSSWGFYYTASLNFRRVAERVASGLAPWSKLTRANAAITQLQTKLTHRKKGSLWQLRSLIGPRIKWYTDVDGGTDIF